MLLDDFTVSQLYLYGLKSSTAMRNLIYAINLSIDGCCDHTKFRPDEETFEYFIQLVRETDTFLYGRKTYELMVPYWPDVLKNPSGNTKADYEYAEAFVAVEKIVVCSRSPGTLQEKNTRIIRTALYDEIMKLKQEPGKAILTGGVNIPSQLSGLGLIDEYLIVVHPLIVGEGRRLFDNINLLEKLKLKLAGSTVFNSGTIVLRYLKT
jgi:dihydrofolate reductase